MKHQIKHHYTDAVLFECEVPDSIESGLRTRYALERAVDARANLAGANFTGAILAGANFTGAILAGAILAGAILADAILAGAYLAGSNFTGANLAGANFTGAILAGANFTGAYLAGAKWRDITINRAPLQLFGLRWSVTILDEHMQIGCELHSLADWRGFDDAHIVQMDGKDALRFWRAHKAALLALAESDGRGVKVEAEAT